jgi:lysophospholipase L1-like esterase
MGLFFILVLSELHVRHINTRIYLDSQLNPYYHPLEINLTLRTATDMDSTAIIKRAFVFLFLIILVAGCGGGSGGNITNSGGGSSSVDAAEAQQKIIFAGDSAAGRGNWSAYFGFSIENRGVDGLETYQLANSIEGIVASKPNKIFITIGGNNILNRHETVIINDISIIIDKISRTSPTTIIYIHSMLPCKYDLSNTLAEWYNSQIQVLCEHKGVKFVSIYNLFKDSKGIIQKYFLADGIHLNDAGYQLWANTIRPLVLS